MKKIFVLIFMLLFGAAIGIGSFQNFAKAEIDLGITSKAVLLMDAEYGRVMFAKNENEKLPIASMVKMMTILLSLEELESGNVSLDTEIQVSENSAGMGGSQVFIDENGVYKFEDLLKSVIVASANDASVALAEYFAGSEKGFVINMNKKAKSLGMQNTHYVNCTGLPAPEGYSTAGDSARLLQEVIKYDTYHAYSTIWMDKLVHPSGRETELVNTNRLIRYYDGCDGGKTGSTNEAGCCLCASAKRNGMRLISAVLGAPNSKTRFNESAKLLNYGFANYEKKQIIQKGEVVENLSVSKGKIENVDIIAKEVTA